MFENRRLALMISLAVIASLLVACSERTTPNPTPVPTKPMVTSIPTTTIPILPTKTPRNPLDIISKGFDAIKDMGSYHADMNVLMEISVVDQDQAEEMEYRFEIDYQNPDRMQGRIAVKTQGEIYEIEMIGMGDTAYIRELDNEKWQTTKIELVGMTPDQFTFVEPANISNLVMVGEEVLEGRSVYHLTGLVTIPLNLGEPFGEELSEMKVDYWIDQDIGLFLKSTLLGEMKVTAIGQEVTLTLDITIHYSNYGKAVHIETPTVESSQITPIQFTSELLPGLTADEAGAHIERGLLSLEDDRLGLALAHFDRAYELRPDLVEATLYANITLNLLGEQVQDTLAIGNLSVAGQDQAILQFLEYLIHQNSSGLNQALKINPNFAEAKIAQSTAFCLDPSNSRERGLIAFKGYQEARDIDAKSTDPYYFQGASNCLTSLYNEDPHDLSPIEQLLPLIEEDLAKHAELPSGYFVRGNAILYLNEYTIQDSIDAWIDIFRYLERAGCPLGPHLRYSFDRDNLLQAFSFYMLRANCLAVDNLFDDVWDDYINLSGVEELVNENPEFKAKWEEFQVLASNYSNMVSLQIANLPTLQPVRAATFNDKNNQVAVISGDWLQVYEANGMLSLNKDLGLSGELAFSPDGSQLVVGDREGKVIVLDTQTGEELVEFNIVTMTNMLRGISISADHSRIAVCDSDGKVYILDSENGEVKMEWKLPEVDRYMLVDTISISPDGRYVATVANHNLRVYKSETGKELWSVLDPCEGEITCLSYEGIHYTSISPDSKLIGTAGRLDTHVRIWDLESGEMLMNLPGHFSGGGPVAFSNDGKRIATTSNLGMVRIWDAQTGEPLTWMGHRGHFPETTASYQVWAVDFSLDGWQLVTGGEDGMARIWDIVTGEELLAIPGD